MTTDAETKAAAASPADAAAKTQSFEADVSRLLHLMVHSVYSDRDIFVRELVSNAADACEKLRYESIARPELMVDGSPFAITIAINPDEKTLTFSDNGVGMSREDLVDALGTIARSGTRAFLDRLAAEGADKENKEATSLIGQFGIGFYSSFMVADEVVVETRRAGRRRCVAVELGRQRRVYDRADRAGRRARARRPDHASPQRFLARICRGRRESNASFANIPAPWPCRST